MRRIRCEACGVKLNPELLDEHLHDKCRWPIIGVSLRWRTERLQKKVDGLCRALDMGEEYKSKSSIDRLRRELRDLEEQIAELKGDTA